MADTFFPRKISSSADSRRASCQLPPKELTLNTGKSPLIALEHCGEVTDRTDTT